MMNGSIAFIFIGHLHFKNLSLMNKHNPLFFHVHTFYIFCFPLLTPLMPPESATLKHPCPLHQNCFFSKEDVCNNFSVLSFVIDPQFKTSTFLLFLHLWCNVLTIFFITRLGLSFPPCLIDRPCGIFDFLVSWTSTSYLPPICSCNKTEASVAFTLKSRIVFINIVGVTLLNACFASSEAA